jgi:Na+/proline symporter
MAPPVAWFLVFLVLYGGWCVASAVRGGRRARTAEDFFLGGRELTPRAFLLVATATTLSALAFTAHAALVFRDGLPYGAAALFAVVAPLAGVLFLKRQWMLGRRHGYATMGEMLADYYRGEGLRMAAVAVALALAVPFLALNLAAAGSFVAAFAGGGPGGIETAATWLLGLLLLGVVASGGLRSLAPVAALQCVVVLLGVVFAGALALDAVGGWEALQGRLAGLGAGDAGTWGSTRGRGGGEYNAALAVSGTIQFTVGLGRETPAGGPWTGAMGLTYVLALAGIQLSPAFTQLALASRKAQEFARQQAWASAGLVGFLLLLFGATLGLAGRFLGADPALARAGLAAAETLPPEGFAGMAPLAQAYLEPLAARLFAASSPWLAGLLAVAAVAAFQVAAVHAVAAGGALARDVYRRHVSAEASDAAETLAGRLAVAAVFLAALLLATISRDATVHLGGLALAFALQMWVPLAGLCWMPWITRAGATWGFAAGILGVFFTEDLGVSLLGALGLEAWGRWPWTVHSAGWGLLLNVVVALVVSALTQDETELSHRLGFHRFLREFAATPPAKRGLQPFAWMAALAWLFFGVGPGAVIGNDLFRAPGAGVEAWTFGMPSIWAWQVMFWAFGTALVWFLAFRMELATPPRTPIEQVAPPAAGSEGDGGRG